MLSYVRVRVGDTGKLGSAAPGGACSVSVSGQCLSAQHTDPWRTISDLYPVSPSWTLWVSNSTESLYSGSKQETITQ